MQNPSKNRMHVVYDATVRSSIEGLWKTPEDGLTLNAFWHITETIIHRDQKSLVSSIRLHISRQIVATSGAIDVIVITQKAESNIEYTRLYSLFWSIHIAGRYMSRTLSCHLANRQKVCCQNSHFNSINYCVFIDAKCLLFLLVQHGY